MAANETSTQRDGEESRPLLAGHPVDAVTTTQTTSTSQTKTKQTRSRSHVLLRISFLLLGDFLANADDTFITAIYDRIASSFNASTSASYLLLCQSLIYAICLPIYGHLGDTRDNKTIILTSYFLFAAGCLLTSLTGNLWLVVLGRVVTCIGGTGLYSMTAIVIADHAEPADVGVLRSYTVAAAFVGRNVGPILGGLLADAFGWRRAILYEVPVAMLCAGVVAWLFDGHKTDETAEENESERSDSQRAVKDQKSDKSMDVLGLVLFAVTMAGVVLALRGKGKVGQIPVSVILLMVSLVFGAALFWRERSIGDRAFIPACVFNRDLGTQYLIQTFWIIAVFAAFISIPVFLARVQNASSASVALHLIPYAAMSTFGNIATSLLIRKLGHYKYFMHFGALLGALGYFLLAYSWTGPINVPQSLLPAVMGVGGGMINASTFMAISVVGDESRKGAIIGFFFLAQEIGCLIGIAGSSNLLNSVFANALWARAPDVPGKEEIIAHILHDSAFVFSLPDHTWREVATSSFVKAWQVLCVVGGSVMVMLQPVVVTVVEKAFK